MQSVEFSEEQYCNEFLSKYLRLEEPRKVDKSEVLSKLMLDMFKYKGSKQSYHTISNLMVLSLHEISNKCILVDSLYCVTKSLKPDKRHKEVLLEEFKEDAEDFQKSLTIGKNFVDLVNRCSDKYRISNIEIKPRFDKEQDNN